MWPFPSKPNLQSELINLLREDRAQQKEERAVTSALIERVLSVTETQSELMQGWVKMISAPPQHAAVRVMTDLDEYSREAKRQKDTPLDAPSFTLVPFPTLEELQKEMERTFTEVKTNYV